MSDYTLRVLLRPLIGLILIWLVACSYLFSLLLRYMGLMTISIELKWTLFVGLNLTVVSIMALLFVGASLLLKRRPGRRG